MKKSKSKEPLDFWGYLVIHAGVKTTDFLNESFSSNMDPLIDIFVRQSKAAVTESYDFENQGSSAS